MAGLDWLVIDGILALDYICLSFYGSDYIFYGSD